MPITENRDCCLRVVDANINRLKEGLRVVEDVARYVFDDKEISCQLKSMRHKVVINNLLDVVGSRDVSRDVAKVSVSTEIDRGSLLHIVESNFRRSSESLRVLEEFFKLACIGPFCGDSLSSAVFKDVRYDLYGVHRMMLLRHFGVS